MDPITLALMAAGLVSGGVQGFMGNRAAEKNSEFQRQNAADQLRMAQAGRTDAFGNTTQYNPLTNQWEMNLTPQQERNVKAGEHEQYLGLTEDAGRNRDIRGRAYNRGLGAEDDFNRALAGFRYDQPHSESAINNEITNLLMGAEGTGDIAENKLAQRQGIRQGGNLPIITHGNGTPRAEGDRLASLLLNARNQAHGEHTQRVQEHNQEYLPQLSQFNQLAQGGMSAPPQFSDTPDRLQSTEDSASKAIQDALKSGGSNMNSAASASIKAAGTGLDPGDFSKMISAMRSGGKPGANAAGTPGDFSGNPATNEKLNPATYGNAGYGSSPNFINWAEPNWTAYEF